MAQIPIAHDVSELIGTFAEGIQNRSLLLDKFAFHKLWPAEVDHRGRPQKWDEASRWSFIRLSDGGSELIREESNELRRKAKGKNIDEDNRIKKEALADIAASLSNSSCESTDALKLRAEHTRRFVSLFQSSYKDRCLVIIGKLEGRLAINLADALVPNAGIALDRLFGLPYIPGSAVKGCARHAAIARLRQVQDSNKKTLFDQFRRIFGTSANDFGSNGQLRNFVELLNGAPKNLKGAVSFLPSYPVDEGARLVVDLTNVHYLDYYRTGNITDLSKEKPRPNPFPAVETGARFAFCAILNGIDPDTALLRATRKFIEEALTISGMGAKTASGYGWFSIDQGFLEQLSRENEERETKLERDRELKRQAEDDKKIESDRVAALTPEQRATEEIVLLGEEAFALYAKGLANKSKPEQRAFIEELRSKKERRERWKKWKKKKQDLIKAVSAICENLKLPPLP